MKKSELRKIIKEEIQHLNESLRSGIFVAWENFDDAIEEAYKALPNNKELEKFYKVKMAQLYKDLRDIMRKTKEL